MKTYVVTLAAIPAVVWAAWPAKPKPVDVQPPVIEGIRVIRMDQSTFRARWLPIGEMPPAIEVRYVTPSDVASTVPAVPVSAAQPAAPRGRLRSTRARLDICARHKMHRVDYGRSWRCRR
jgi:hypothetical protein